MLDKIKEAFDRFTFLSPTDLLQLAAIARVKVISKHEHILAVDDINYNLYFVLKGLLRHYSLDRNDVDRTLRFVPERHFAASLETVVLNKPATDYIEALETTLVLKIDARSLEDISNDNIRLLRAQNLELKSLVAENVRYLRFLNLLTAEERYYAFTSEFPRLETRVKQKYLASYLGITPTSLSRLKARVVQ